MKYFAALLIFFCSLTVHAQDNPNATAISATIVNELDNRPLASANVININTVKGAITNEQGKFTLAATVNDTLHITMLGFKSLRLRVTNDWIKNKETTIYLTEKAYALEEVIIRPYKLTGYLEIDAKLVPSKQDYRYSISGIAAGYEVGDTSPQAFKRVVESIFNPADLLYNVFGKKPKELKRLREMKKDDTVRNLLESKYDRETISILLGVSPKEISEILERCNYSEAFIKSANDLQIMDAISACYEEYKILKKRS